MAAATIGSGVGKSGSPAPKPTTSRPLALSALALASTASVADSAMAAMRREMRPGSSGLVYMGEESDSLAVDLSPIVADRERRGARYPARSEEHTSELQSPM